MGVTCEPIGPSATGPPTVTTAAGTLAPEDAEPDDPSPNVAVLGADEDIRKAQPLIRLITYQRLLTVASRTLCGQWLIHWLLNGSAVLGK